MSGTLALIFLLWGPATQPGNPPSYTRSVLAPGDERYTLPPNTPNREFYLARNRLQQGYNPQGGTPVGYDFSTLPANTLPECQAYLRSHYRFFEEAAESDNRVIQDARCVLIPPGKMLGVFHDGGYDEAGNKADAFRLLDIPAAPKQEGPSCANMKPNYPEEAEDLGIEAQTVAECSSSKQADGYWHHQNCRITSVTTEKGYKKAFSSATMDFLHWSCSAQPGDATGTPGVYVYHVDYAF